MNSTAAPRTAVPPLSPTLPPLGLVACLVVKQGVGLGGLAAAGQGGPA